MGLANLLHLAQAIAYVLACIFSLFIFIPVCVNNAQFGGHCPLFASGTWNTSSSTPSLIVDWPDPGYCNFAIFVGVFILPLAFILLIRTGMLLYKEGQPSWVAAFVSLLTSSTSVLLLMVAGIIVTAGFQDWCRLIQKEHSGSLCEDAQYLHIETATNIDFSDFYSQYEVAQFGIWSSFVVWTILLVTAVYQLHLYHREENFLISLRRERQRLIRSFSTESLDTEEI